MILLGGGVQSAVGTHGHRSMLSVPVQRVAVPLWRAFEPHPPTQPYRLQLANAAGQAGVGEGRCCSSSVRTSLAASAIIQLCCSEFTARGGGG